MALSRRDAFLRQARSDFAVFRHLLDQGRSLAPADHDFGLLVQLRQSGEAAQVLRLIRTLLDRFEAIFG
jgi:hypothetical protein